MQVTVNVTRRQGYGQHRRNPTYTPPNVNDPFREVGDEGWDVCQFTVHPRASDHRSTSTLPQKRNAGNNPYGRMKHNGRVTGVGGEGRTIRCLNKTPRTFGEGVYLFRSLTLEQNRTLALRIHVTYPKDTHSPRRGVKEGSHPQLMPNPYPT